MKSSVQAHLSVIMFLLIISAATHRVYYVSPDNSTNTSCPFQPCATLSQYLLDNNGSLPVVSNVEYHFLPGEHHVPTNMTLQYLHNFTMTGSFIHKVSPAVLFIDLQIYVEIGNSVNVTVSNMVFKTYDKQTEVYKTRRMCNVVLNICLSCKIENVTFLDHGFCGINLGGKTYLSGIVMNFTFHCYTGIYVHYHEKSQNDHCNSCTVVIDRFFMHGRKYCIDDTDIYHNGLTKPAIIIRLPLSNMLFIISNSQFLNVGQQIMSISNNWRTNTNGALNMIWITDCIFENNTCIYEAIITLSAYNNIVFSNCSFQRNQGQYIIRPMESSLGHFSGHSVITNCSFIKNKGTIIYLVAHTKVVLLQYIFIRHIYMVDNSEGLVMNVRNWNVHISGYFRITNNEVNVLMLVESSNISFNGLTNISDNLAYDDAMIFRSSYVVFNGLVNISDNVVENSVMLYKSSNVSFNGLVNISDNHVDNTIIIFQASDIIFNASITISNNKASTIQMYSCNTTFNGSVDIYDNRCYLPMHDSIIKFQFCNILFSKNILIASNVCKQIVVLKAHQNSAYIRVTQFSNITFTHNNHSNLIAVEIDPVYNNPYPFCLFQYVALENTSTMILPSHYTIIISDHVLYDCKVNVNHYTSHCKWISSAAFHDQNPKTINQQIIRYDYKLHHTAIFSCANFSINILGPVYPGQMLQTELCMPCSFNYSVLYVETHEALIPKSACKVAHQTEIFNTINHNSLTASYTIVSEVNNSCELFLTVSPFLYYIYEVFDVQLLPCPIGFTLQNGVCDCDPLLPTNIDTCYIEQSAIRCPANTWIIYTQSSTSKYLISDCPMDYCLPFSSTVNLLHPDTQCQFNRTGILCSQCQHHLSMVFGSSRCMKCTNAYIFIAIIVIVAGVILVVSLYLLNLTVTKATISGVILYANVVSINDSVFLINDKVFKPLQVFISFANLDLGFDTCFYNGMSGYVKIWLQLFFPIFLIFMAFAIIIASRYSSRILRLTYSRSLPVLATLFLLSYTSVLRTVLTVLFSYSTITHLPSGHQELVWSVDASVPLFGLKFTILFITCLVLFLILFFFNFILLFRRCLIGFRLINHFKPILDAYQGSYKDRYYYWIAVHIILRSSFFVLYAFSLHLQKLLATMILVPFIGVFGYSSPNKNKLINFQELLLLINLTIMHAVSYYNNDNVFGIVTNLMITLAFIQFCIIVVYHFLTYTCHCDIERALHAVKEKLMKHRREDYHSVNIALLDIPERTYNYSEYQDGLVSDDFVPNREY